MPSFFALYDRNRVGERCPPDLDIRERAFTATRFASVACQPGALFFFPCFFVFFLSTFFFFVVVIFYFPASWLRFTVDCKWLHVSCGDALFSNKAAMILVVSPERPRVYLRRGCEPGAGRSISQSTEQPLYTITPPTAAAKPNAFPTRKPWDVFLVQAYRFCQSIFFPPSHGASRLVQAMPACLVKTRRAPSRHSRDARVYGHTTTAMHKLSTPSPIL